MNYQWIIILIVIMLIFLKIFNKVIVSLGLASLNNWSGWKTYVTSIHMNNIPWYMCPFLHIEVDQEGSS